MGVSSAIQRPRTGSNYSIGVIGPRTAVTILVHQAPPTEALVSLGRSRILGRIWVPPEQKEKDVYELTEILDAYHLFRALSGKIQGYGITRAQLETEAFERGTPIRTDFEQLVKLQEFLISLMLIAPTSAGAFWTTFQYIFGVA
jgi:hypothetical protein